MGQIFTRTFILLEQKQVYKSVSVVLHRYFRDLNEVVMELCLSSIYFCLALFSLLSCLIKQAERGTSIWSFISLGLGFSRNIYMSDTELVTVLMPQSKVINSFGMACGDYKLHVIYRGQEHSHEEP